MSNQEPKTDAETKFLRAQARNAKLGKWLLWVGAVVVVGVIVVANSKGSGGSGGPGDDAAQQACQSAAQGLLKAPATADFSNWRKAVASTATAMTVYGTVDAENSFGAKIRNTFTCQLHSSGDSWVVDDISGL